MGWCGRGRESSRNFLQVSKDSGWPRGLVWSVAVLLSVWYQLCPSAIAIAIALVYNSGHLFWLYHSWRLWYWPYFIVVSLLGSLALAVRTIIIHRPLISPASTAVTISVDHSFVTVNCSAKKYWTRHPQRPQQPQYLSTVVITDIPSSHYSIHFCCLLQFVTHVDSSSHPCWPSLFVGVHNSSHLCLLCFCQCHQPSSSAVIVARIISSRNPPYPYWRL